MIPPAAGVSFPPVVAGRGVSVVPDDDETSLAEWIAVVGLWACLLAGVFLYVWMH